MKKVELSQVFAMAAVIMPVFAACFIALAYGLHLVFGDGFQAGSLANWISAVFAVCAFIVAVYVAITNRISAEFLRERDFVIKCWDGASNAFEKAKQHECKPDFEGCVGFAVNYCKMIGCYKYVRNSIVQHGASIDNISLAVADARVVTELIHFSLLESSIKFLEGELGGTDRMKGIASSFEDIMVEIEKVNVLKGLKDTDALEVKRVADIRAILAKYG